MEGLQTGLTIRGFTTRELEILDLLGRAYSRKDIYEYLHMAERTLNTHINHISIKTGCHGYASLVRYAQDHDYGVKISGARTTEPLDPSMLNNAQKPESLEIVAET